MADMKEHWEGQAQNWVRWARTPLHDSYWWYRDSFFAMLPAPGSRTLDVGCGEGRVTRDLAALGHAITGIDASPTLIGYAREAHVDGDYVLGDASTLPFADESFDLVVAYNSLMDFDDMPGSVREAGRVLAAGGRFCFCVTHPLADAGKFESREPDARFIVTGGYYGPRSFDGQTFQRDGLEMTFKGWAHSIEEYSGALEDAGFVIEQIREPQPTGEGTHRPSFGRWKRVPLFLMVRAALR